MHEACYIRDWYIEPNLNRITGPDGEVHQVGLRAMQVLVCLIEHAGEVVPREQLFETVWGDTVVGEESLTNTISDLRKIFQDEPRRPRVIETIRSVGYRLVASVVQEESAVPGRLVEAKPENRTPKRTRSVKQAVPSRHVLFGAGLVVVLILVVFLALFPGSHDPPPDSPYHLIPLTTYPGREYQGVLSPDGTQVAFISHDEARQTTRLYLKHLDAETPIMISGSSDIYTNPAWSPDGTQLVFMKHRNQTESRDYDCGIYMVTVPGTDERRLIDCYAYSQKAISWSPDGSRLAFSDRREADLNYRIYILSLSTLEVVPITGPEKPYDADMSPVWSPDGQSIAFVRGIRGMDFAFDASTLSGDIFQVSVPTNLFAGTSSADRNRSLFHEARHTAVPVPEPKQLTFEGAQIRGITWMPDGKSLVYATHRIYRFDLDKGRSYEVFRHPLSYLHHPDMALHENRLVFERWSGDRSIWQTRLDGVPTDQPMPLIKSTSPEVTPAFSPDGQHIAFASDRSGYWEIWISDANGQSPVQLTHLASDHTKMPNWSPDGRWIAFETRLEANSDIYLINSSGGQPIRLTDDEAEDRAPYWSNDGQWLYFGSRRSGSWQVWKVAVDGGTPLQVTRQGGYYAKEVHEEGRDRLYYARVDTPGLWQMPLEGGAETMVTDKLNPADWGNWIPVEDGIYFVDIQHYKRTSVIKKYQFATHQVDSVRYVTDEIWGGMPSFGITPDGESMIYVMMSDHDADIVMIDGFE